MKKLMFIIASLFLATSVASASPSKQMDFTSMNKADSQFLFDGSTNAIALSSQEMKETEGEWGFTNGFISLAISIIRKPNAHPDEYAKAFVIGTINPFGYGGPYGWNLWW